MAIIVPILGNLRGSVGANTFSHNRGGDYVRRRVSPTNPNSTRQQTMRTILAGLAAAWSQILTANQRAAWNVWAANQAKEGPLGNSINLTGINGFIWCNSHILDASDARRDDPPAQVAPGPLDTFAVDVSAPTTAAVAKTAWACRRFQRLRRATHATTASNPSTAAAKRNGNAAALA